MVRAAFANGWLHAMPYVRINGEPVQVQLRIDVYTFYVTHFIASFAYNVTNLPLVFGFVTSC